MTKVDALYRFFAEKYGWSAQQVSDMTPAQIAMYVDATTQIEDELRSTGHSIGVDTRTGHRTARVDSMAAARRLAQRIQDQKNGG